MPSNQPNNNKIIVTVTPPNKGDIIFDPKDYQDGQNIKLTAEGKPGYIFSGWGGDLNGTNNPIEITLDSTKNITASFNPKDVTLSVASDQGPVIRIKHKFGDVVNLHLENTKDWIFNKWSGDVVKKDSGRDITINMDDDKNIEAHQEIKPNKWGVGHTLLAVICLVAIGLSGFILPSIWPPIWSWIISMILLVLFIFVIGHGITGHIWGFLVDDRFMMSMSRLQSFLWTVVILSAFLISGIMNVARGDPHPLEIAIPTQIWLVMGISAASLVGSPLIRDNKEKLKPEEKEMGKNFKALSLQTGINAKPNKIDTESSNGLMTNQGLEVINTRIEDASISDLFRGEETGNCVLLDLGKIQVFFFTVLIVLVYASALGALFQSSSAIHSFPALDDSTIALLGISHATYLVNKGIPHSDTAKT
ncbi:MAG TPA: hypothetical protein VKF38_03855 [Anaerolineaceae bacterium]|nr:hypothetical protein [Anaerolineaceae bacterium]